MTEEVIAHLKETNGSSFVEWWNVLGQETSFLGRYFCLFLNTTEHKLCTRILPPFQQHGLCRNLKIKVNLEEGDGES